MWIKQNGEKWNENRLLNPNAQWMKTSDKMCTFANTHRHKSRERERDENEY